MEYEPLNSSLGTNAATKDEVSNPKSEEQNGLKVLDTWTDEEIRKLISEVKRRPRIWNAADKQYRKKLKAAWHGISSAFGNNKTVDQLVAQWKNLHAQYRSSVLAASKTNSGQGSSKSPPWKFYWKMAFVDSAKKMQSVCSESNSTIGPDNPGGGAAVKAVYAVGDGLKSKFSIVPLTAGRNGVPNRKCDSEKRACSMTSVQCATPDDTQMFANYLASDLRRIKSEEYQKLVQQQLLKLAWDLMDKQPAASS